MKRLSGGTAKSRRRSSTVRNRSGSTTGKAVCGTYGAMVVMDDTEGVHEWRNALLLLKEGDEHSSSRKYGWKWKRGRIPAAHAAR